MSQLCDLISAALHCMFGGSGAGTMNTNRIETYRTRLSNRIADATREMEAANRFKADRTLVMSERRAQAAKAKRLALLIAGAHKKLSLLDSTSSAVERVKDDADFLEVMKRAGLSTVTKRLEDKESQMSDLKETILDLEDLIDVHVDESELELDEELNDSDDVSTLPLLFPEAPRHEIERKTRGSGSHPIHLRAKAA